MKKLIITQRIVEHESYSETRDCIDVRWSQVCSSLKVFPIFMPSNYDVTLYIEEIKPDGIILSGGNDLYSFSGNKLSNKRDQIEKITLDIAVQRNIPVLGICRGMQLITEYFGGKLIKATGHVGVEHSLKINTSSRFAEELNSLEIVNSYHNYCVEKVPDEFIPSAWSDEGYSEAMEHKNKNIFAQMWHPEREKEFKTQDLQMMKKLFDL